MDRSINKIQLSTANQNANANCLYGRIGCTFSHFSCRYRYDLQTLYVHLMYISSSWKRLLQKISQGTIESDVTLHQSKLKLAPILIFFCSYNFQPRAYGVKFRHGKKYLIAKCHSEVILSAGAISSPQILMLSGIGPAEHLQYHGIPVKVDLPVGRSLQSHVGTGEIVFTMKAKESYNPQRYITNPGKYFLPYFTRNGEGPLGSPAGFEVLANFRTGLDNSSRFGHWHPFNIFCLFYIH